jgi:hypothetical protein
MFSSLVSDQHFTYYERDKSLSAQIVYCVLYYESKEPTLQSPDIKSNYV